MTDLLRNKAKYNQELKLLEKIYMCITSVRLEPLCIVTRT